MKKKRKIVVDKKFQIGLAALFTAISAFTIALIIILIAVTSLKNNHKLDIIVRNQQTLTENQNDIFETLIAFSKMKNLNKVRISVAEVNKDMSANKTRLDENNSIIIGISRSNNNLIRILIAFVIIQSGILFYVLIKRSHRISGPMLLLNRYITEIKNGKYPDVRPMRPKDDFKELFENFRQMVEKLKKKK